MRIIYFIFHPMIIQDMISLGFSGYNDCELKVTELLPDRQGRILDFGCGTGIFGAKVAFLDDD